MRKFIALILLFVTSFCFAEYYNEYQIPMRDSKWLAADLWTADSSIAKPIILIQTPYNKDMYHAVDPFLDASDSLAPFDLVHYHYVIVDWRGFYGSTEASEPGYNRGLDGYDCVEWIAEQSWSNGKIGTSGGSALGMQQFKTIWEHPPHLVCSAPWIKNFKFKYSNYFPGGILFKEHAEAHEYLGFISMELLYDHVLCCDFFWTLGEENTDHADKIDVPILVVTGWFDHSPDDIIEEFHEIRATSIDSVRHLHKLMVGPWTHSGIGKLEQGELEFPTADGVPQIREMQFFAKYLRGADNGYEDFPVGEYFIMQKDELIHTDDWFSVSSANDTFYLQSDGELSLDSPLDEDSYTQFEYDPRDPSPAYGADRFDPTEPDLKIGPYDIRDSVESRDDCIIFSTPPLDEEITIAGRPKCIFYVSTNRLDTDIAVRITDVYPDGRSMILADAARRMRLLESYAEENLITPGEIYPVEIELRDLAQSFQPGHRIRIVISGSIYPLYDRNLNNGGPMYEEGDSLISTTCVYHNSSHPSMLILPIYESEAALADEKPTKPQNIDISAYPNPFNSKVSINIPDGVIFEGIYDIRGKLLFPTNAKEINELNGSNIINWQPDESVESGIYLIRVYDKNDNNLYDNQLFNRSIVYIK
ncbi:MAG: CocE/NonD family hydrolase [Candidatus Zixiibacteriota bacterium]